VANGYGGDCSGVRDCGPAKTIYRLNNDKFKVQGAVSSSSRLERLKLETLGSGEKRISRGPCCPHTGGYQQTKLFGPTVNNISCTNQRKYKALFNIGHNEVNYPQTSALARARGAVSFNTTVNPNGGVCCENPVKPQLLM
jgi:hypothetical protein